MHQKLACRSRSQSPFLRWIFYAGFAVTCFLFGWACHGVGREKRGGVVFGGKATTSVSERTFLPPPLSHPSSRFFLGRNRKQTDTLVVYIFANSDPEAPENLAYFLRHGAKIGDGADYLVVVQGDEAKSGSDNGINGNKSGFAATEHGKGRKEEQRQGGEKLQRPRFSPTVEAALSFAHDSVAILAHENICYDWGTFGWALRRPEANKRPYKFWLLVNSSVRGPFVHPASASAAAAAAAAFSSSPSSPSSSLLTLDPLFPIIPWHAILTSRLRGAVHAAGPVISCEPSPYMGQAPQGPWAVNPHVQSWAVALDAEALEVLRAASPRHKGKNDNKAATKEARSGSANVASTFSSSSPSSAFSLNSSSTEDGDGGPLDCARDRWDAIWSAEIGSSRALLEAGMNLDCLLPRYQGVDWRKRNTRNADNKDGEIGKDSNVRGASSLFSVSSSKQKDSSDPLQDPWLCNQRFSPSRDGSFDGLTLMPFDTMFVKFKRHLVDARAEATVAAAKLAQWEDQRWWRDWERRKRKGGRGASSFSSSASHTHPFSPSLLSTTGVDIVTNAYVNDPATHKVPRFGALLARGEECFDSEAYLSANPELRAALPQNDRAAAWSHALQHGQFELRPMAFRCSAFGVPDGIMAEAAASVAKGSMFSLSERAKKAAAAGEATRSAFAAAGLRETIASAAEHGLFFEGGVEDDARGDFEDAGLVWAYSDGRRAAVVFDGGTEGSGGALLTSRFRRRVATTSAEN